MPAVDSREPSEYRGPISEALGVTPQQLVTGDYIIEDSVGEELCIERKTISDFVGSMGNHRLFDQANRMVRDFPFRAYLIEGGYTVDDRGYMLLHGRKTLWKSRSLQNMLFRLQFGQGFKVIPCPDRAVVIDTIIGLRDYWAKRSLANEWRN